MKLSHSYLVLFSCYYIGFLFWNIQNNISRNHEGNILACPSSRIHDNIGPVNDIFKKKNFKNSYSYFKHKYVVIKCHHNSTCKSISLKDHTVGVKSGDGARQRE